MYVLINPSQHPDLKKRISSSEYYSLSWDKRKHYSDEDVSTITENNSELDDVADIISIGLSVSSLFDDGPSSDSSDSSFSGFDGGDTGGGGAGGDW